MVVNHLRLQLPAVLRREGEAEVRILADGEIDLRDRHGLAFVAHRDAADEVQRRESAGQLIHLAGCVAGQSLQTTYEQPAAAAAAAGSSVLIAVTDDRPYVKNGKKPSYYLGKYRAGFGNPWDVTTDNDEPLASIVARDLATDLAALGAPPGADLPDPPLTCPRCQGDMRLIAFLTEPGSIRTILA